MIKLKLKNVRCFTNPGAVRIAPLTILLGENSTGKSSFLALQKVVLDLISGYSEPNFNNEPFYLGAYDQIAHYRGGRGGRAQSFEIGVEGLVTAPNQTKAESRKIKATYNARFVKDGSQPAISNINFRAGKFGISVSRGRNSKINIRVRTPSWSGLIPSEKTEHYPVRAGRISGDMSFYCYVVLDLIMFRGERENFTSISQEDISALTSLWSRALNEFFVRPYSIAPVRTKPERTYNPIEDTPRSQGGHVPMLLAKTRFAKGNKWDRIRTGLQRFGEASGLFSEIYVKSLGRSDSDPFQILVSIFGHRSNLVDVGYGVSQVLPIITDILMSDESRFYLMQQPEVHLHPRAQAELGTFFLQP